jgi:hypothetical protein
VINAWIALANHFDYFYMKNMPSPPDSKEKYATNLIAILAFSKLFLTGCANVKRKL